MFVNYINNIKETKKSNIVQTNKFLCNFTVVRVLGELHQLALVFLPFSITSRRFLLLEGDNMVEHTLLSTHNVKIYHIVFYDHMFFSAKHDSKTSQHCCTLKS